MNDAAAIILIILIALFAVILAASLLIGFFTGRRGNVPARGSEDKTFDTVRVADSRGPAVSRGEAAKLDIDDRRLLQILYNKNIAPYGISKKVFFGDMDWAQAELRHAKERVSRLALRLNSSKDAMDVYFGGVSAGNFADVVVAPRLTGQESSSDIRGALAGFERSIRDLSGQIADSRDKGRFEEIRRILHDKEAEFARLRMELSEAMAREKGALPATPYREALAPEPPEPKPERAEKAKTVLFNRPAAAPPQGFVRPEAPAAPAGAGTPARAPTPAPIPAAQQQGFVWPDAPAAPAAPKTAPVPAAPFVAPAAPKTAPAPVSAAPAAAPAAPARVGTGAPSAAAALEPEAELRALLTVVNAIGAAQRTIPDKITALAKKCERKRIELEDMKKLILLITGNAMEAYADRVVRASDYLDGLILLNEAIAWNKLRMAEDDCNARARIKQIAAAMRYDYAALVRVEEQVARGGVLSAERVAVGADLNKSVENAKNMRDALRRGFFERLDREKLFYSERAKLDGQFAEANERKFIEAEAQKDKETAFIRKEFMEQFRRMEDARSEFFAHFSESAKGLPQNDYAAALRGLRVERAETGALYFTRDGRQNAEIRFSLGGNRLSAGYTAHLADGSVIDAAGEIVGAAPKLPDGKEEDLLRAKMAERKARAARQAEMLGKGRRQVEPESVDEAIGKIESQFRGNFV
ncbi:MAG: hypothetical protein LBL66_08725 [Clostridiales bacterium]|nr:hypothetical protein [Clostridiales bacterium]